MQRGGGRAAEDHPEAVDESKRHIWIPTSIDLQLRRIKSSGGDYWLMFPLELTKKDYLRRILEIVAEGISERVVSASAALHYSDVNNGVADPFPTYPAEYSKFDAQYLLKHIIGQGNHPTEKKLKIQQAVALQLHCNYQEMASAAGVLFQSRNSLFHMARGGVDDTDINVNFNAAVDLLQCFGVSASEALAQLNDLRGQYDDHMQFKMRRSAALGWDRYLAPAQPGRDDPRDPDTVFPPPPPVGAVDMGAHVEDLERRCEALIESIGACLTPATKATALAICTMQGQVEHLGTLCTAATSREAYEEAGRLNSLQKLVEATIARCGAAAWLAKLSELLSRSDALIQDIGLAVGTCTDQKKFAAAARLHMLYGNAKAAKDGLKQSWAKVARHPTSAELTDASAVTSEHLLYRWGTGPVRSSAQALPSLFRTLHLARLDSAMADICSSWLHGSRAFCADAGAPLDHWSATARRTGGFTAAEVSSAFDVSDLKGAGYAATDMKGVGYAVADLKGGGYSHADILGAGYPAVDLKDAGYPVWVLKGAGYRAADMKLAGYSHADILGAGYPAAALRVASYSAAKLKGAGYPATELKGAGYPAVDLRHAGYSDADILGAGYPAVELRDAGYSCQELRHAGCSAVELRDAGYSDAELKGVGYSAVELRDAGCSGQELEEAGFSEADILGAGFTYDTTILGHCFSLFCKAALPRTWSVRSTLPQH